MPDGMEKHLFYGPGPMPRRTARPIAKRVLLAQTTGMRIDPDKRREDIAQVTIDLAAREGLAAATFRRIAAEAGWSTASITNYFVDKQDLLVWTFQVLAAEGERRFEEALAGADGDPLPALLTMVPWCPANVRRWKAYLAFWDAAVRDPELASLLAGSTSTGMDLLDRLLQRTCPAGKDRRAAVERLSATVQGVALQILVDPENWGEAKIRRMLLEAHGEALS
jgi:AcrR family transcriptional regulator